MDNWTFGITLMIVGMGGTMAALGLFAVLMGLLKRVFPVKEEPKES
ncbi:MAG: OadG-related small transporter subunit [Thermodesulfobacteriota bacterium]